MGGSIQLRYAEVFTFSTCFIFFIKLVSHLSVHVAEEVGGSVATRCMNGAPRTRKPEEDALEHLIGNLHCLSLVIHVTSTNQEEIALGALPKDISVLRQTLRYLKVRNTVNIARPSDEITKTAEEKVWIVCFAQISVHLMLLVWRHIRK